MKFTIRLLPILAAPILLLQACSGNSAPEAAQSLFNQADSAFQRADYSRALLLLDSLQKNFPAATEVQRMEMQLRPKVIEKATLLQISTNDSLMACDKIEADQLSPRLKWVKTPGMIEGYWVGSDGYNSDFMNSTGIQGRVSEIGEFYVVSSVKPGSINHTSIALSLPDGSAQAATQDVAYDGESNYRIDGGEVITFSPAQSDTIGNFALAHRDSPLTLTFKGKSSRTLKLSARQTAAIADAYAYARATDRARSLAVERERLEAALQVARNQIARTTALPD